MPVVQVSQAPSREEYELVERHLDMRDNAPDGLIVHAAAETEGGEVQIVDVWESRGQMEAFQRERLFPAFEAAGVMESVGSGPPPTAYEPFHYVG